MQNPTSSESPIGENTSSFKKKITPQEYREQQYGEKQRNGECIVYMWHGWVFRRVEYVPSPDEGQYYAHLKGVEAPVKLSPSTQFEVRVAVTAAEAYERRLDDLLLEFGEHGAIDVTNVKWLTTDKYFVEFIVYEGLLVEPERKLLATPGEVMLRKGQIVYMVRDFNARKHGQPMRVKGNHWYTTGWDEDETQVFDIEPNSSGIYYIENMDSKGGYFSAKLGEDFSIDPPVSDQSFTDSAQLNVVMRDRTNQPPMYTTTFKATGAEGERLHPAPCGYPQYLCSCPGSLLHTIFKAGKTDEGKAPEPEVLQTLCPNCKHETPAGKFACRHCLSPLPVDDPRIPELLKEISLLREAWLTSEKRLLAAEAAARMWKRAAKLFRLYEKAEIVCNRINMLSIAKLVQKLSSFVIPKEVKSLVDEINEVQAELKAAEDALANTDENEGVRVVRRAWEKHHRAEERLAQLQQELGELLTKKVDGASPIEKMFLK